MPAHPPPLPLALARPLPPAIRRPRLSLLRRGRSWRRTAAAVEANGAHSAMDALPQGEAMAAKDQGSNGAWMRAAHIGGKGILPRGVPPVEADVLHKGAPSHGARGGGMPRAKAAALNTSPNKQKGQLLLVVSSSSTWIRLPKDQGVSGCTFPFDGEIGDEK